MIAAHTRIGAAAARVPRAHSCAAAARRGHVPTIGRSSPASCLRRAETRGTNARRSRRRAGLPSFFSLFFSFFFLLGEKETARTRFCRGDRRALDPPPHPPPSPFLPCQTRCTCSPVRLGAGESTSRDRARVTLLGAGSTAELPRNLPCTQRRELGRVLITCAGTK